MSGARRSFISKNVKDHGVIKYKLPKELKNTEIFETFQQRKRVLDRACTVSRQILNSREWSHQERSKLQQTVMAVEETLPKSKLCVPRLADKTQKQAKDSKSTEEPK